MDYWNMLVNFNMIFDEVRGMSERTRRVGCDSTQRERTARAGGMRSHSHSSGEDLQRRNSQKCLPRARRGDIKSINNLSVVRVLVHGLLEYVSSFQYDFSPLGCRWQMKGQKIIWAP